MEFRALDKFDAYQNAGTSLLLRLRITIPKPTIFNTSSVESVHSGWRSASTPQPVMIIEVYLRLPVGLRRGGRQSLRRKYHFSPGFYVKVKPFTITFIPYVS